MKRSTSQDEHAVLYGHSAVQPPSEDYLFPELRRILTSVQPDGGPLFEIGAGGGWTAQRLTNLGYDVTGIEPSVDGVALARRNAPGARIELASAYDNLSELYGRYRTVFALEVIEHLYSPRIFARNAYELLEDGGHLIVSTPFHGYWKNLILAATGKMDAHFTALWDHGHIKFWSRDTLSKLLKEAGFRQVEFSYAGRFYPFPKSFFACAQR